MGQVQRIHDWFRGIADWLTASEHDVVVVYGPAEMHLFAPMVDTWDLVERRWS